MELEKEVEKIKKEVGEKVESRISQFERLGDLEETELFKELCFCILTANFDAERAIKIQESIDDGFIHLSQKELSEKLKSLGYRYPNKRAEYIVEARKHIGKLKRLMAEKSGEEMRKWLSDEVKGLGYKEASHFLRNVGCKECAIIDFHIVDLLARNGLAEKPKTMTKKKYLEIEEKLKKMAKQLETDLARLDLYLWCLETGKILK